MEHFGSQFTSINGKILLLYSDWQGRIIKYDLDGTISKNNKDMALAGRVAKGMDMGCIACNRAADDKSIG